MKFQKLQQSGFILESKSGFRLAIDIGNKTPTNSLRNIPPVDAFIVSHIHGDHFHMGNIGALNPKMVYLNTECFDSDERKGYFYNDKLNIKVIFSGENLEVGPFNLKVFSVDHGPNISGPVENLGFLLEADSEKIYFSGDMFYPPKKDISDLEIDYALIPIGTFYTFGPEEAYSFAKKFKKIGKIIPMHYEKKPETAGDFLSIVGKKFEVAVL